jgi:gluconokinase
VTAVQPSIVVMGASGSGKSTVGTALAERLGWSFVDGDSFHSPEAVAAMAAGHPLTDADRWPWLGRIRAYLDATDTPTVVACSALRRAYRDVLRDRTRFVYLDVDRDVLAARLAHRGPHFVGPSLLDSQLTTLEPPGPDENAIRVVPDVSVARTVDEIVARLAGTAVPGEEPAH